MSDLFKDNFVHQKEEAAPLAAKLAGMFNDAVFQAEAKVDSRQNSRLCKHCWWFRTARKFLTAALSG